LLLLLRIIAKRLEAVQHWSPASEAARGVPQQDRQLPHVLAVICTAEAGERDVEGIGEGRIHVAAVGSQQQVVEEKHSHDGRSLSRGEGGGAARELKEKSRGDEEVRFLSEEERLHRTLSLDQICLVIALDRQDEVAGHCFGMLVNQAGSPLESRGGGGSCRSCCWGRRLSTVFRAEEEVPPGGLELLQRDSAQRGLVEQTAMGFDVAEEAVDEAKLLTELAVVCLCLVAGQAILDGVYPLHHLRLAAAAEVEVLVLRSEKEPVWAAASCCGVPLEAWGGRGNRDAKGSGACGERDLLLEIERGACGGGGWGEQHVREELDAVQSHEGILVMAIEVPFLHEPALLDDHGEAGGKCRAPWEQLVVEFMHAEGVLRAPHDLIARVSGGGDGLTSLLAGGSEERQCVSHVRRVCRQVIGWGEAEVVAGLLGCFGGNLSDLVAEEDMSRQPLYRFDDERRHGLAHEALRVPEEVIELLWAGHVTVVETREGIMVRHILRQQREEGCVQLQGGQDTLTEGVNGDEISGRIFGKRAGAAENAVQELRVQSLHHLSARENPHEGNGLTKFSHRGEGRVAQFVQQQDQLGKISDEELLCLHELLCHSGELSQGGVQVFEGRGSPEELQLWMGGPSIICDTRHAAGQDIKSFALIRLKELERKVRSEGSSCLWGIAFGDEILSLSPIQLFLFLLLLIISATVAVIIQIRSQLSPWPPPEPMHVGLDVQNTKRFPSSDGQHGRTSRWRWGQRTENNCNVLPIWAFPHYAKVNLLPVSEWLQVSVGVTFYSLRERIRGKRKCCQITIIRRWERSRKNSRRSKIRSHGNMSFY
jgi:hypothetical protein